MSLGTDTSARTPWLIGGAMALVAASACAVLGQFVGLLTFFLPGDEFDPGTATDFAWYMLRDGWPYLLSQTLVGLAALGYVVKAHRSEGELNWGSVGSKALILLVPAIFVMTVVLYLISLFHSSSGFGLTI